jgi:hypothetical protein
MYHPKDTFKDQYRSIYFNAKYSVYVRNFKRQHVQKSKVGFNPKVQNFEYFVFISGTSFTSE